MNHILIRIRYLDYSNAFSEKKTEQRKTYAYSIQDIPTIEETLKIFMIKLMNNEILSFEVERRF